MESLQNQEVFIFVALGIFIMLGMAIAFVAFHGRAQQKLLSQKLAAQELVLQETILAQEEERNRIAKELHDDIGSKLNVMFLFLQQIKKNQASPEEPSEAFQELTQTLNTTIDTTRRIAHELLPPTLDKFGLAEALKELCDGFIKTGFLKIDLNVNAVENRIKDKMTELNIFRILQELINNSVRHGKATEVAIRFVDEGEELIIQYQDNGKGFEMEGAKKGLGMNNIESRLKMIKGNWEYVSSPGNGLQAMFSLAKDKVLIL